MKITKRKKVPKYLWFEWFNAKCSSRIFQKCAINKKLKFFVQMATLHYKLRVLLKYQTDFWALIKQVVKQTILGKTEH